MNAAETLENLFSPPRLPELPRRVKLDFPKLAFEVPLGEHRLPACRERQPQVASEAMRLDAPSEKACTKDNASASLRIGTATGKMPVLPCPPGGYTTLLLRKALDEALVSAGLDAAELPKLRVGVCLGTTVSCQLNNIEFHRELQAREFTSLDPIRNYLLGIPSDWVKRTYGTRGPSLTVSNACSSSADALIIGKEWLASGACDIVIAGGCDELNRVPMVGFAALGVCSSEPCRPFDRDRGGLNLGEGAGVVIMETEASRTRRDARKHFSLVGTGKTADAYHITQPHPEGLMLEVAVRQALAEAGLQPADIAFANAHGTGTQANDLCENKVFARVFGSGGAGSSRGLKFMSTKTMTGHTLGAAGVIEFILSGLMLQAGVAVKSHRFENLPDDMLIAPLRENTAIDGNYALSTSLAFGGSNTAIIIKKCS